MGTPASESTATVKASVDVHHQPDCAVLTSSVRPDPGGYAIVDHSTDEAVQHSAAAVVVGGTQEDHKATKPIYSPMNNYPPPKTRLKKLLLRWLLI